MRRKNRNSEILIRPLNHSSVNLDNLFICNEIRIIQKGLSNLKNQQSLTIETDNTCMDANTDFDKRFMNAVNMDGDVNQMHFNRLYQNQLATHMAKHCPWNPLRDQRIRLVGEAALKQIQYEECQKINFMDRVKLFKYVKLVTKSLIWPMGLRFQESYVFPDGIEPDQLMITVKTILIRIQFRLKGCIFFLFQNITYSRS